MVSPLWINSAHMCRWYVLNDSSSLCFNPHQSHHCDLLVIDLLKSVASDCGRSFLSLGTSAGFKIFAKWKQTEILAVDVCRFTLPAFASHTLACGMYQSEIGISSCSGRFLPKRLPRAQAYGVVPRWPRAWGACSPAGNYGGCDEAIEEGGGGCRWCWWLGCANTAEYGLFNRWTVKSELDSQM